MCIVAIHLEEQDSLDKHTSDTSTCRARQITCDPPCSNKSIIVAYLKKLIM